MKNVLASLIAVGLIGGSQVLAEPPSEAKDSVRTTFQPHLVRGETDREARAGLPRGPEEETRRVRRAADKGIEASCCFHKDVKEECCHL